MKRADARFMALEEEFMDAIVVLTLLVILALAAPRWGRTSSNELHSKEHDLATYGMSWPDPR